MAAHSRTNDAEILVHAQTYHRFMLGVKWAAIHLAATIVFLVVGFATDAGVWSGIVAGIVVLAVGIYAMNHGLSHSTERDNPAAP